MEHEQFTIEIDGEEIEDLYACLTGIEVELDDELAAMTRITMPIEQAPDGAWSLLDDERLAVWQPLTVSAGFEGNIEGLFSGYITQVHSTFEADPSQCMLEIWAIDASIVMDREEKLKTWPSKKDSDIASELFRNYGFIPQVEDTGVIHDEEISTVVQRETDMQFLKRLALRNGFECFVEEGTGYFRPPALDAPPQPILAAHFGAETNLNKFAARVDALAPTNVSLFQFNRLAKEVLEATIDSSLQTALGQRGASDLVTGDVEPGQMVLGMSVTTGVPEMEALCRSIFNRAQWFVEAEGEINGAAYGHVLKPRRTVTIKGVGETHSGVYYVNHVNHSFTSSGYTQTFQVRRNGILPTGNENFSGDDGLLGNLL